MNLKKSKFNIEIDKLNDGRILIFNAYTSSYGILDQETKKIYSDIEHIDLSSIKNKSIIDNISTMAKNGFLVDQSIDETKLVKYNLGIARFGVVKQKSLIIAPTLNCNMACSYCFENKYNASMDTNTKSNLIEFTKQFIAGMEQFNVIWFGGEPLLESDTIVDISKEFIEYCKKSNIGYKPFLITNGTLLDSNMAKMLKSKCGINSAQITIDGVKEKHNNRKRLINGQDSFNEIIRNIDEIKDIIDVTIRINVDKDNINYIDELVDFLMYAQKWENKVQIYFSPVFSNNDICSSISNKCFSQMEFGHVHSLLIRNLYNKGLYKYIRNWYPSAQAIGCGALSRNELVVGPNGDFYKCTQVIGQQEHNVGNVKDGIMINQEYLQWLTLDIPKECEECNLINLCQGGCAYRRINNNHPLCEYTTISYNEILKIVYEDYNSSHPKIV